LIEDKELGLKVAETKEESIWEKVKRATEMRIKEMEESLIVERELLILAESKTKA
jgi:hypothetical protein